MNKVDSEKCLCPLVVGNKQKRLNHFNSNDSQIIEKIIKIYFSMIFSNSAMIFSRFLAVFDGVMYRSSNSFFKFSSKL